MVDKSLTTLPGFISAGIFSNLVGSSPPTSSKTVLPDGISRGFDLFVQSVRRTKNKYNEGQIVDRELQTLQANLSQPNTSMVQIRDYLCRMIYCHMLGYDVTFGLIHAVKLAQQGVHLDKKTGYMSCCLLMHRDHELILLLVNTIQKDLKSSSILDNMAALSACSQLVPVEMIPSILPMVLDKLKHSRELVRQKAVVCLYQFQLLAPDLLEHNRYDLQRALFDKDPGVMATAVHIVHNYIQRDPERCKDLGESLVAILKQIASHRMGSMFEYHTVPFPWLQIQIIKCLAKLAPVNESLAKSLVPVLKDILQRTSIKETIAFSILYECIQCIVRINPPRPLLDDAAQHVERFLLSSNPNLKFIGVKLLVSLVQVNPEYSLHYQQLIVQSLENSDLNIQKKMYKLLYEIANETNVSVVCAKLLTQLQMSTDIFWRSEVTTMLINLVERFDKDVQWQIETVFTCLHCANDIMKPITLHTVMNMVEKKFLRSQFDQKSQKMLVQKCVSVLVDGSSVAATIHISTWVLGELCPMLKNMPDDKVLSLFTRHLTNEKLPYSVQSSVVSALQNLLLKGIVSGDTMATKVNECLHSQLPTVIKQRLTVILGVCRHSLNICCHDNMDTTLTFLDDLVTEYLEGGGAPYVPIHLRGGPTEPKAVSSSFDKCLNPDEASSGGRPRTESTTSSTKTTEDSESVLKLAHVKRVWGVQGRLDMSTKKSTAESASHKGTPQTEEEIRQQQLASALFGNFQETMDAKPPHNEDNNILIGFTLNSTDNAGWRNVHESTFRAKLPAEPSDASDIEDSDDSTVESKSLPIPQNIPFIETKLSPSADCLHTAETVDIRTDVLDLEHLSTDNEHETFKLDENLTNNQSKLSGDICNDAKIILDSTPGVGATLKDLSNSDVDQVVSALLDDCDSKPITHIENSLVQLEIDSTDSQRPSTGETVEMGNNTTAFTDVSDNMYTGCEDYNGEELGASIYEDDAIQRSTFVKCSK